LCCIYIMLDVLSGIYITLMIWWMYWARMYSYILEMPPSDSEPFFGRVLRKKQARKSVSKIEIFYSITLRVASHFFCLHGFSRMLWGMLPSIEVGQPVWTSWGEFIWRLSCHIVTMHHYLPHLVSPLRQRWTALYSVETVLGIISFIYKDRQEVIENKFGPSISISHE
jgi:hypothetical protein